MGVALACTKPSPAPHTTEPLQTSPIGSSSTAPPLEPEAGVRPCARPSPYYSHREIDPGTLLAVLQSVDPNICKPDGGVTGKGEVQVTFVIDGTVADVVIVDGPFADTRAGKCLTNEYRKLCIPPFEGNPRRITMTYTVK
jgi:hypothetical protein